MKLQELETTGFIKLIVYVLLGKNKTVLVSHQVLMKGFHSKVFQNEFHFGVGQRIQKLTLHQRLS